MRYTSQQRRGLLVLIVVIVVVQFVYVFYRKQAQHSVDKPFTRLERTLEHRIDSLKKALKQSKNFQLTPFNPNFISDYKGYILGMTTTELARLRAYRDQGLYVNSQAEFQQVTKVSDSLLLKIAPFFKFPDFVKSRYSKTKYPKPLVKKDINTATKEELIAIHGIGEALSKRILSHKEKLGGFVMDEQLYTVYGLSKEVADKVLEQFTVQSLPNVEKININKANLNQLSKIPYVDYDLAQKIVGYRTRLGIITDLKTMFKDLKVSEKTAFVIEHYITLEK